MYTVQIQKECKCFKKSEYENTKTFEKQKDAYQYANILVELMNEEFCSTHTFASQRVGDKHFLISVDVNLNAIEGYTPHITCDTGCSSTDKWSLETEKK
ncbi:hypothetical protein MNB_SV-13-5 [hydrothermal vent metagenome]|uniref:Uncharacterized protein n=1 Tax=hydrothermal vent metagenome TaxID=652676 RepID=A0A1W1CZI3_9ZZZZ